MSGPQEAAGATVLFLPLSIMTSVTCVHVTKNGVWSPLDFFFARYIKVNCAYP
jgi:hypothetical protein